MSVGSSGESEQSDPVPVVEGNSDTNEPVLVLVAGLNSETGIYDVAGGRRVGTPEDPWGDPWNYLGDLSTAGELKAADVIVIPTAKGSTSWPDSSGDGVLDSTGSLNGNMFELAGVLRSESFNERAQGHPIILVGHSYGGVIIRSMLASGQLPKADRERIAGVIQFGSPNGGSLAARFANTYKSNTLRLVIRSIAEKCAATLDLDPGTMQGWNLVNPGAVGVPVVRFGGTFLPDALDIRFMRNADHLFLLNNVMNGETSDGVVSYTSLSTGDASLPDQAKDFGGGGVWGFPNLAHAGDIPGVGNTYYSITYEELVPQGPDSFLFSLLARKIAVLTEAHTTQGTAVSSFALDASTATALPDSASSMLPSRSTSVSADGTAEISVSIDTSAVVLVSSAVGQPSIVVRSPEGEVLACPVSEMTGDDGTRVSIVTLDSPTPGDHIFSVSLPAGAAGDVLLSGVLSGGAQFGLASSSTALAFEPVAVTARFESASGAPLVGASVSGTAALGGQPDQMLAFADDGNAPDSSAGDGLYTASFAPPVRGRWLVVASGFHDDTERIGSLVLDVGESLAMLTGEVGEVVTAGRNGTIGTYAVSVPLQVSEEGTYTVTATLNDSRGVSMGMLRASQRLGAGESMMLIASVDAAQLAGMAPGPLTVGPIRITRYTDGVDLLVGSAPGFITAASYSADDFCDFSISLSGPSANPSSTGAVHFTGTAHNTPSTVASVEYSIDGSTTWQPIEALDGAFDSSHEDFEIDLDLPDYVYGIYVRQTGADGVQLPVGDWAGIRFTVDTVAPTQPADLAAVVTSDTGSPVAQVSWLPSDPPSDVTSLVGYRVSLDGIEVGMTCGTDFDVPLPDEWRHTITVTPIDLAGNIGAASEFVLGTTETDPPTTTLTILPTAPDGEDGWYVTAPEVSLSTDEPATTYFAWDGAPAAPVAGAITAPEGTHQLSFYSVDTAENQEATQTAVVRVDLTPPSAPVGLQATPQGLDQINLQWNAAVDAHSGTATYLVYRADGSLVGETTGTSYAVTGLEASTQYSFYVVARDAAGHTSGASDVASDTTDATQPPVLAPIGNKTVSELMELAFTVVASDADSDVLAYSLVGAPQGASIHSSTGAFTWTPTEAQGPGTYPMMVVVSDGTASDFETITITVEEVNIAPLLAPIGDKAVNEGSMLTFRASASDADSNPLTFSLVGAPPGAFISESTGVFIWTPTEAQGPGTYTFTVGVTDGAATDTETITVTVAEVPDVPTEVAVTPVEGAGRVETAIAASQLGFATSEYVVIATARSFPDALGGSALAGALDAPILLTEPTTLSAAVKAEIARLEASHVIVLGGTGAVSADVFDALDALPGVTAIERIFGDNRYATAEEIAERTIDEMGAAWDGTAFAATGESFPDALGASPVAAAKGWPIYLVHPDPATYAALIAKMRADGVTDTLVLGGNGAVYSTFTMQLGSLFEERLEGLNRYTTAIEVAKYGAYTAGLSWDRVALATGQDFPDALSGGALQGASGSVMLLVHPDYLYSEIAFMLTVHKEDITEVRFLGGTGAVPQVVRDEVVQALQ